MIRLCGGTCIYEYLFSKINNVKNPHRYLRDDGKLHRYDLLVSSHKYSDINILVIIIYYYYYYLLVFSYFRSVNSPTGILFSSTVINCE
jgi:hypothetical protein